MNHLSQLSLNNEGFVFDPTSGESYTTNTTGLLILNGLRQNKSPETIAQALQEEFDVNPDKAERDVADFQIQLRTHQLLS
jgi:PqqD family protein of HPr-rel-A system